MSIQNLAQELVFEIIHHLHPNDVLAVAATCISLRPKLTPQSLSFAFAKTHLEATARLAAEVHSEPWDSKWLHCLEDKAPVRYADPLLFNYGVAAVALNGFSFNRGSHLGRLMLGCFWQYEACKRRRMNFVRVLDAARRMGLIRVDTLPIIRHSDVLDAFLVAALGQSMELMKDIVAKYSIHDFMEEDYLNHAFRVATSYQSVEPFRLILLALSNESLERITEPVARVFVEACIEYDFADPIALLPASHSALFLPWTSSLTLKAVSRNRTKALDRLLEKGAHFSTDLLFKAVSFFRPYEADKKVAMVRHLLGLGADPNATENKETPLYRAARCGAEPVVDLLLETGVDVNAAGLEYTPLEIACQKGHSRIVKRLLEAGAKIEARGTFSFTPLHHAVTGDNINLETVKIVLDAGVDVNARDSEGHSALHLLCELHLLWKDDHPDCLEICKLLVNEGANLNARDEKKRTPLEVARRRSDHPEVVNFLSSLSQ
ncbi:hypothetical protein HDU96_006658 [Phlyctochytrium bullatum]|nr:hypothetical protein HDU96_006658 [Phlyctochytrium bullatum]